MATNVYQGATQIGRVSTSGEVYDACRKVGWVNGNGDIYQDGIWVGWITHAGQVLDPAATPVGFVDATGGIYKGSVAVGRVECVANPYCTGGGALLLLFGKCPEQHLGDMTPEDTHLGTDPIMNSRQY